MEHISQTMKKNMESLSDNTCPVCGKQKQEYKLNVDGKPKVIYLRCECELKEYDDAESRRIQNEKQVRLDRLLSYSLMDRKFTSCTLKNWDNELASAELKKVVEAYIELWEDNYSRGLGIILHGKPGTGKTYAAFSVVNELLERGRPVIVISSIGILNRIKDSYRDGESENEIHKNLQNADLLVIDDIGAEHYTEWAGTILYKIIDDRYRLQKPMIVTTNLDLDSLQRKLSTDGIPRAYDRIREMCVPVKVKWQPIRKQKGNERQAAFIEKLRELGQ